LKLPRVLALSALVLVPSLARAETLAPPFLLDASFGFGIEPHDRQAVSCSSDKGQQCDLLLTFDVQAEALWRGFIGPGIGLFVSQGTPVQVNMTGADGKPLPSFGDRVSVAAAVAVRPFAPLSWRHGEGYLMRLLAGFELQVGPSIEYARTALASATNVGFHFAASLDLPLYGANTRGGLALRLAVRVMASPDANFNQQPGGNFLVVEPGTATQLFAGIAYFL
jgi:hypothetical protein